MSIEPDGINNGLPLATELFNLLPDEKRLQITTLMKVMLEPKTEKAKTEEAETSDLKKFESSVNDLAVNLGTELFALRDFIEIANDRAIDDDHGKVITLLVAAMQKANRALELAEQLEMVRAN